MHPATTIRHRGGWARARAPCARDVLRMFSSAMVPLGNVKNAAAYIRREAGAT